MLWQPPLPAKYTAMTEQQLVSAIHARKAELGSKVVILGHHYQQDQVIQFADFTGDSFKLSQLAAEQVKKVGAKYVIFAGVHFMAESADILAPDGTVVILPDMSAGCSMADMADYEDTLDAWDQIHEVIEGSGQGARGPRGQGKDAAHSATGPLSHSATSTFRVIPICYMNCSAAIKAFCGERGGAVCTSSNCTRVLEWALAGGIEPKKTGEQIKIIFIPDQHLGRNTAASMGYDIHADMCLWDPKHSAGLGGNDEQDILRSTFILWKGHCSVHKLFRPEHVDQIRAQWPDVTVIVHPECAHEVVQKADMTGSTEGIMTVLRNAKPGTRWVIGTEVHMVNRLCNEVAKRGVEARILSDCQCLCTTMYRIDLPHLLWVLDHLAQDKVVNEIKVHPNVKLWSLAALDRMLQLTGTGNVHKSPAAALQSD